MKLRILLINPWIYDFAAVNLWSRPLGLMKVAERLSSYDVRLSVIDCTGTQLASTGKYPREIIEKPECIRAVPRKYGRYGISSGDFTAALRSSEPFDIVFVTSVMSYWYPGVQEVIHIVKTLYKDIPVLLGGIYAILWPRHASASSGADFIYQGHVRDDIAFVVNTFGFRMKKKEESSPYPGIGLFYPCSFAPLLTSSGCPYRCSYCASTLLSGTFAQRDPLETAEEVRALYAMGIREFAFYDDALLVNADDHIKVILREILRSGLRAQFHCPNGLHARHIDDELAVLMKKSGFRTLRLSLETVDEKFQKESGGKVTNEDLARAVGLLKKSGFTRDEIGVYLMYGLPGQTLDMVAQGVEFVKGLDVRINLTEFSPIPGTASWDKLREDGILSDDLDPLLTNNTVFPLLFAGYDEHTLRNLKLLVKAYNMSQ